jgi:SAM-dependent methyltransferase
VLRLIYNSDLARRVYRTPVGRFVYHLPGEIVRFLSGRRSRLAPPMWMVYTGRGDFEKVGDEFLGHFRALGGLQPGDRVLDIGSGIGRMAIPLTRCLSEAGSYVGLEIVKDGVDWCAGHITPRYPNFVFVLADIRNDLYNQDGATGPESYRLPFADHDFDFVFLTSVFTHMHPAGVRNYLREISRVLRPGRRCLFTCSLIDDEAKELVERRKSALDFRYCHGDYYSLTAQGHTKDVAFDVAWLERAVADAGLHIVPPIHFGRWSGRSEFLSHQDIVVVEKPV